MTINLTTFFVPHRWPRRCRTAAVALVGSVLLTAAGCRTITPPEPQPQSELSLPKNTVPRARVMDESPLLVNDVLPERAAGQEDTLVLPERQPARLPKVKIAEYPDNLIKGIVDPDENVEVLLNFDAAPLNEIVPLFAELLNFSYLIDPSVKGAVTMTVETQMTAREAWEAFEHILWLAGAYASRNPGFIHIMPFAKMPQERRLLARHDPHANVEVAFLPILNTGSAEIAGQIRPFMTDGATVTDLPRINALLIVEAPANMPKLHDLINILDNRGEAQWPQICLRLHQVDVETVMEELKNLLPVIGLPVAGGQGPSGGAIKLVAVPRLQVLVASAALHEVLLEVERWVKVLDKEDSSEQENMFFYNVQHSTAEQLNEALGVFFNTSSTASTVRTVSSENSTAAKATGTTANVNVAGSRRNNRQTDAKVESTNIFETPVVVYADTLNNRLTIRTTQRAYAMVQALLSRLDVPPRQVAIQAMIADINLTKSTEYGFAYAAQKLLSNGNTVNIGTNHTGLDLKPSDITPTSLLGSGFAFAFKDMTGTGLVDRFGFIRAVAGENNVRVLSAPQVVTVSDTEAVINVGDRIPVPTETLNTTSDNFQTNYQYQDTGVIMTVTPHITAGNEVRLDVKQEVSTAAESEDIRIPPRISNKVLQTSLTVPDGGTVLMGGLIQTNESDGHAGIPVLKNIPGIGVLFRTNRTSNQRTELLVLMTVNVIDGQSTVEKLVRRYQTALRVINNELAEQQ